MRQGLDFVAQTCLKLTLTQKGLELVILLPQSESSFVIVTGNWLTLYFKENIQIQACVPSAGEGLDLGSQGLYLNHSSPHLLCPSYLLILTKATAVYPILWQEEKIVHVKNSYKLNELPKNKLIGQMVEKIIMLTWSNIKFQNAVRKQTQKPEEKHILILWGLGFLLLVVNRLSLLKSLICTYLTFGHHYIQIRGMKYLTGNPILNLTQFVNVYRQLLKCTLEKITVLSSMHVQVMTLPQIPY